MPIPLLFIGIALGGGLGADAGRNMFLANQISSRAEKEYQKELERLNHNREAVNRALTALGNEKVYILSNSITGFLQIFSKIKNIDFTEPGLLQEQQNLNFESYQKEFEELKFSADVAEALKWSAGAGTAGSVTALGAYGLAHTFACASTGTAIASLHGIAATNATLAFFGGGSLAAGGGGIAAGTAVLGGIVAAPALIALGGVLNAGARKELKKAKEKEAEIKEIIRECKLACTECSAIRRRAYQLYNLLARLDALMMPLVYELNRVVAVYGEDYRTYPAKDKSIVRESAATAVAIKAVLDTPVLNEDGSLNTSGSQTATAANEHLQNAKKRYNH